MAVDTGPSTPRVQGDDPLLGPGGSYSIGFDGSPASRTALAWAIHRAGAGKAPFRLVGVVDDDAGGMGREYAEESAHRLAELLSRTADSFGQSHPDLAIDTVLARGEVVPALVEAAGPQDLVVIGSDKTGYAQGRVYGFRSVQIAAASPRPVAVIPSVNPTLRAGVVVGVVDVPQMLDLVRAGAREAAREGCPLTLLHAVPLHAGDAHSVRGDEVLSAARAAALEEGPRVEVISHLAHQPPADALLNLTHDKALLLLGRSRSTGPLGVGGTLHDVLINANSPIVVLL